MPSGWRTMEVGEGGGGGGGTEDDGDRLCIEDYLLPRKMPARGRGKGMEYHYAFRCPSPPLASWELRMVKDRKLKSLPPKPPDPIEQLFLDIKAQPKLRPVKDGRLVEKKRKSTDDSDEEDDDWDEDADCEYTLHSGHCGNRHPLWGSLGCWYFSS
ncbi:hypothetical protein V1264_024181 [Littorina saxatilis]|uniref:Uncharacterized protein n=1 Tax=Littorina saxatilis TaxID=31220 RepID=A0AAN9AM08_9CAEN